MQQNCATCHTVRDTIQLLHETFPCRVLSRFCDKTWPPRSCDLAPLGFEIYLLLLEVKGICQ